MNIQQTTKYRFLRRFWLAACVTSVSLGGCQSPVEDPATQLRATHKPVSTAQKAANLERNVAPGGNNWQPSSAEIIGRLEAQAVDPAGVERLVDAITCLARTIYWEARGENMVSTEAVASVVMNRVGDERFPNTVCGVVTQGTQGVCQFSWWCDGRPDQATEVESYALAKEIARQALNRQLTDQTGGALYFHHRKLTPSWSGEYIHTAAIGEFIFYKPPVRGEMRQTTIVRN